MRAVRKLPGGEPEIIAVDNTLEALQRQVGAARASFRRGGAGKAQCREMRRALPGAGSRGLPSGRRREAGRGRAWPREAHKGRVAGAAARGGQVAGRRGAGGLRGFPGRTRGRRGGRRARGGKAGAAPRCRGATSGGAGKTAAPSAACVGFQATSVIEAASGRKSPFLPYKEALFPGARFLSNQSCFAPESLSLRSGCFFGGAE